MLTIGDRFPEFALPGCAGTAAGKEFVNVSNSTFSGKWGVVFFWPLDFTFVCPTEIVEFGRLNTEFEKRNAKVLGCSIDSQYVHLAWRQANDGINTVPFPMLSDLKRELTSALGILHKQSGAALRATFVVDPEGIIRHVSVHDLPTGRNVNEVLRTLDALQTGSLCPVNWEKGKPTL